LKDLMTTTTYLVWVGMIVLMVRGVTTRFGAAWATISYLAGTARTRCSAAMAMTVPMAATAMIRCWAALVRTFCPVGMTMTSCRAGWAAILYKVATVLGRYRHPARRLGK